MPMRLWARSCWNRHPAPLCLAAALVLATVSGRAGAADGTPIDDARGAGTSGEVETSSDGVAASFPARGLVRALIEQETAKTNLPPDIAEAVVFIESRYDATVVGRVGEVGLMQVRPATAAMLGFNGSPTELAKPEVNIHYGVTYLAEAWRLAQGDLCRALMKYRAGHGEESMTARSTIYCKRARNRLIAMNSRFAAPGAVAAVGQGPEPSRKTGRAKPQASPAKPTDVYATYKQGTAAASRAFWAMHETRVREIKARIEAKWRRVASG